MIPAIAILLARAPLPMLSLGSVFALLPVVLIIILIGAAAGLTRGSDLLAFFGIETVRGLGGGQRSGLGKMGVKYDIRKAKDLAKQGKEGLIGKNVIKSGGKLGGMASLIPAVNARNALIDDKKEAKRRVGEDAVLGRINSTPKVSTALAVAGAQRYEKQEKLTKLQQQGLAALRKMPENYLDKEMGGGRALYQVKDGRWISRDIYNARVAEEKERREGYIYRTVDENGNVGQAVGETAALKAAKIVKKHAPGQYKQLFDKHLEELQGARKARERRVKREDTKKKENLKYFAGVAMGKGLGEGAPHPEIYSKRIEDSTDTHRKMRKRLEQKFGAGNENQPPAPPGP